jgi:hypothetical protein
LTNQRLMAAEVKSAALRAATRVARVMTTQWSRDAIPKGLRSVLVSLQGAQPGPISALSALVDFVIVPAVREWFVYNSARVQGLVRLSRSHCDEATDMVVSVLRQVAEMEMEAEQNMETKNGFSSPYSANSSPSMTLRAHSALIQPRMALAAFLEETLKDGAREGGEKEKGEAANHLNLTREASGRIVVSCFDLYLLHIAVDRFAQDPTKRHQMPAAVMEVLRKMPPPAPLPGTETWGERANPYVIVPLPQLTHASRNSAVQDREVDALVKAVRESLVGGGGGSARLEAEVNKSAAQMRARMVEVQRNQKLIDLAQGHLATMQEIIALGEGMNARTPRTPRSADRAVHHNRGSSGASRGAGGSPAEVGTPTLHLVAPGSLDVPTLGSPLHELLTGVFSPLKLEQTAPW